MSSDGIGYLIPDNAQPDEMDCILVFYPDDPFYLRALIGSISYLSTWTAWQRDADRRGRLAAEAWKEANECTFDTIDMGCLDNLASALTGIDATLQAINSTIDAKELAVDVTIEPPVNNVAVDVNLDGLQAALDAIRAAIEANGGSGSDLSGIEAALLAIQNEISQLSEEDMQIINNIHSGCGCGCGCGCESDEDTTDIPNDPIVIDPEDPLEEESLDDTEIDVTDVRMCRAANYFAEKSAYMLRKMVDFREGIGVIGTIVRVLVTIAAWLSPLPGDEVIATSVWLFIAWRISSGIQTLEDGTDFIFDDFAMMAEYLERNGQEFVCKLYGFSSASDLSGRFESFIDGMVEELTASQGWSSATSTVIKSIIGDVVGPPLINRFVNGLADIVPDDYISRYPCNCDDGVPAPEADDREFVWVEPDPSDFVVLNENAMVITSPAPGVVDMTPTSGNITKEGSYEWQNVKPADWVATVGIEIEVLETVADATYEVPRVGSYSGNSSPDCDLRELQKRFAIASGFSAGGQPENQIIYDWATAAYPDKVDVSVSQPVPKGWPRWLIDDLSVHAQVKIRILYEVTPA